MIAGGQLMVTMGGQLVVRLDNSDPMLLLAEGTYIPASICGRFVHSLIFYLYFIIALHALPSDCIEVSF